jgi:NitT/TauT family transport system permease protein
MLLALLWSVAATVVGSSVIMPTPSAIALRLTALEETAAFWRDAWITLLHLVAGYAAAMMVGIPLGIALGVVAPLRFWLGALFNGLAAAPLIAFAPLTAGWFGIGDGAKIALVFLVAGITLTSDIMTGLARKASIEDAGGKTASTSQLIFAAMRRALVLALTAALVGEMLMSKDGLGNLLMTSFQMFELDQTVAILLFVSLPFAVFVSFWRWIEKQVGKV